MELLGRFGPSLIVAPKTGGHCLVVGVFLRRVERGLSGGDRTKHSNRIIEAIGLVVARGRRSG